MPVDACDRASAGDGDRSLAVPVGHEGADRRELVALHGDTVIEEPFC